MRLPATKTRDVYDPFLYKLSIRLLATAVKPESKHLIYRVAIFLLYII
jgi:hypothetical protein